MAYGITITVGSDELVTETDDVLGFELQPQYAEQITPLAGSDAVPDVQDRANLLCTLTLQVLRLHASANAAAAYLMGLPGGLARQGTAEITVNGGTSPQNFSINNALVRVYPGAFRGADTICTWTFIGPAPVSEP
jgi:hypothetical protein